jgi:DNA polymerase-1
VDGEGPKHPKLVVVGEAPGLEEDREGRPFIGTSGKTLRKELAANKLADDTYVTLVVRCRPPDNRKPTAKEIKACRPYLEAELERLKPEFVVSLGATPTKVLFSGKSKVTQFHGTIVDDDKKPYRGFISYHPAAFLYDPSKLVDFQQDFVRLKRAMAGETRAPNSPWAYVRRGNLEQFILEFTEASEFGFDVESSGYFMHKPGAFLNALSISLRTRTWVIPLMNYDPINKRRKYTPWRRGDAFPQLVKRLVEIQHATQKRAIGQNGKFDNLWLLRTTGHKFRLSFDTMLAHHLLDENSEHDLKSLARSVLDVPEYDLTKDEKIGNVVPRKLYRYCAFDSYYTRRLKKYFLEELRNTPELHRLYFKLVMPVARAMEEIEMVGKTINLPAMEDKALDLRSELVTLEKKLNKAAGYKINWNSPAQIAKLLFDELELESTIKTDTGAPSTSEEALFNLRGEHPIADMLVTFREKSKLLSTYIYGFQELMVGNKLFVSYKIHGTVGGRFSSRFHSIPRDGTIRNLVEAPPGWKFWVADIQQAELRFAAHLSGDLEMRRCFKEGIDIHWRTLMHCLSAGYIGTKEYIDAVWKTAEKTNCSTASFSEACEGLLEIGPSVAKKIDPIWSEGRYRAKAVSFGYIYGMRENKFVEICKTDYGFEPSWDEAHSMREGYFQLYNGLEPWHEREKRLCRVDGYNRTLTGRRRRLPLINSGDKWKRAEAERQAVNIRVQSFIGDYKSMCLVEIQDALDPRHAKIIGEHHDAVLGIVRDGYQDETLPTVRRIMKSPKLMETFHIELDIPMESEIQVGAYGKGTVYNDPE